MTFFFPTWLQPPVCCVVPQPGRRNSPGRGQPAMWPARHSGRDGAWQSVGKTPREDQNLSHRPTGPLLWLLRSQRVLSRALRQQSKGAYHSNFLSSGSQQGTILPARGTRQCWDIIHWHYLGWGATGTAQVRGQAYYWTFYNAQQRIIQAHIVLRLRSSGREACRWVTVLNYLLNQHMDVYYVPSTELGAEDLRWLRLSLALNSSMGRKDHDIKDNCGTTRFIFIEEIGFDLKMEKD